MNDELQTGKISPEEDEEISIALPYRVVLFNDEWHSFDEVINQIVKAVKCSYEEARSFAFEAHVKGKAVVFKGELSKCLKVTSVLEEISLHTQIIS